LSVIAGAQRFAHTNQLRADRALHALLGMKRFPSDDTILNYFRRFSQAEVERFWRPLWRWLISRLPQLEKGFSLDLDSTIFSRHGAQQQGAARGYNPRRPGRLSHHPLLAVLAEANFDRSILGRPVSVNHREFLGVVYYSAQLISHAKIPVDRGL